MITNPLIDERPVDRISLFQMGRMDGVGVVTGNHEAVRKGNQAVLAAHGKPLADTVHGVLQESGSGALSGLAAHLLVVKEAVDRGMLLFFPCQKAFDGSKGAVEIVQSAAGDVFP